MEDPKEKLDRISRLADEILESTTVDLDADVPKGVRDELSRILADTSA